MLGQNMPKNRICQASGSENHIRLKGKQWHTYQQWPCYSAGYASDDADDQFQQVHGDEMIKEMVLSNEEIVDLDTGKQGL